MIKINQLKLPISHTQEELDRKIHKLLNTKEKISYQIIKRSLDARKKPDLFFSYTIHVLEQKDEEESYQFPVKQYNGKIRPLIIGMGPAGIFCGYMLARAGFCPIILERGRAIEDRKKDVSHFWKTGILNPESNVQFGEGGAGTFSDGKLNTLVKEKYGRNREVLRVFTEHGAPREILYDYKPHIGTDRLQAVVTNMRNDILSHGGEIHFSSKVTDFSIQNNQIHGVVVNNRDEILSDYVVLAPGHSARDTMELLRSRNIHLEPKPFAVGFRVEHPQWLINLSQYGNKSIPLLGSAAYKVTATSRTQKGVYSFCMCPGGYVVNASSEQGRLAVNGMSYYDRNSPNANSAIIVTINPQDYHFAGDPLQGMYYQRSLEEKAFQSLQGKIPVERYCDFVFATTKNKLSIPHSMITEALSPCIKGSWGYGAVHDILSGDLNRSFMDGMEHFGRMIKGFNEAEVLVEGLESRTSSPIRIVRDEHLQSSLHGLYPCGEGAGYAGGITSAAMDGILIAEEISKTITGDAYGSVHEEKK